MAILHFIFGVMAGGVLHGLCLCCFHLMFNKTERRIKKCQDKKFKNF